MQFRIGTVLVLLVVPAVIAAQAPVGADTISASAAADSQAVLRELDATVRANKRDAAAWHRRGMVAWVLSVRAEAKPKLSGLDAARLRRLADTSLIIAAGLDLKNVLYQLAAGEFLRASTELGPRVKAIKFFEDALALARAGGDAALLARTVIAVGRMRWLSYEDRANRILWADATMMAQEGGAGARGGSTQLGTRPDFLSTEPGAKSACETLNESLEAASLNDGAVLPAVIASKLVHNQIGDCLKNKLPPDLGDYTRAEQLFREAYTRAPEDTRAFRHLSMLLAERSRWGELSVAARERTNRFAADPWGWLVLGLALHRSGNSTGAATAAFEKGLQVMNAPERGRLFAFERLMNRQDSIASVAQAATRADRERSYWNFLDPLWSRKTDDPRSEFLARVVFAEIRWTADEMGKRGADTDRGEMHIRFGPPNTIIAKPVSGGTLTWWDYNNGLAVVFRGNLSYGTSYFPASDKALIAEIVDARPASFDNIVSERILEIPTQLARFRAPGDSVDALLLMHAPVPEIRGASGTDAAARVDFWLLSRDRTREQQDSVVMRGAGVASWTNRVSAGDYQYRVEATADGSTLAGRAMGWFTAGRDTVTGFSVRGFGMSDLVLASEVRLVTPQPLRWSDLAIVPALAPLPKGATLQMFWENYEVGARDGTAQYSVVVTLERQRSARGRIAAQIVSTLSASVGVDRKDDRVVFRLERTTPPSATIIDLVSLNLAETPSGTYRMTVEVMDKVSGRKTMSRSSFTIQ